MLDSNAQFGRVCTLLVGDKNQKALDLSELRIKFAVKRSAGMTPNTADIRVYNVEEQTAIKIRAEFKTVILQAGYQGNFGVIFQGNIKQVIIGRESGTDTFIDIIAGDGDRAYNYAVVNETLAKGSSQSDQINSAIKAMSKLNVTKGFVSETPTQTLARGKVLYGQAKNILKNCANSSNADWSIQNEQVNFLHTRAFLPNEAVVLTSTTGLIGTPQQTNEGVNCKCLINPLIKIGARIKIDNKSIERLKINLSITDPKQIANSIPAPLTADGVYYVLVVEHAGDTRGNDWYSNLIMLNISITSNPANSVQVDYGQS